MVIALAAQGTFLRQLPAAEAGRLVLLLALVQTVGMVGGLGQPSLVLRVYSRSPIGSYNWGRDLVSGFLVCLPVLAVAAWAGMRINDLPASQGLYVAVVSSLLVFVWVTASAFNAHRLYALTALLYRLPNALLLLPAVVVTLDSRMAGLSFPLLCFGGFALINVLLGLGLARRLLPSGTRLITVRERVQGLLLLAAQLTVILPDDGLIAILGGLVEASQLAAYVGLLLLFGVFKLTTAVVYQVLVTELTRAPRPDYRFLALGLGLVAAIVAGISAVILPPLSHWLYGARYDAAASLVPAFALSGALQLTESLPLAHMVGRASDRPLSIFIASQVLIILGGLAAAYVAVSDAGIHGMAWSAAAIYLARNALAYAFMWRTRSEGPGALRQQ